MENWQQHFRLASSWSIRKQYRIIRSHYSVLPWSKDRIRYWPCNPDHYFFLSKNKHCSNWKQILWKLPLQITYYPILWQCSVHKDFFYASHKYRSNCCDLSKHLGIKKQTFQRQARTDSASKACISRRAIILYIIILIAFITIRNLCFFFVTLNTTTGTLVYLTISTEYSLEERGRAWKIIMKIWYYQMY